MELLPAADWAADAEDEVPRPTNSAVTEAISAAVAIRHRFIFDSGCRILGRLPRSRMGTGIGQPDEDVGGGGDAEAAPSEPVTTVGPADDVHVPNSGPFGSLLLMTALLKLRKPECRPFM
ncbi:MAG TPA: hypothetical protein VN886_14945 [Acidimicrobiales bacterium]|nr:hypothetical protein [Acidimicrobiales bacterium]